MKILFLLLLTVSTTFAQLPKRFVDAIHQVESSGRVGGHISSDGGAAIGPLSIHESCWHDSDIKGKYFDCYDYNYSVKVLNAYLNKYGSKYLYKNNWFMLARIWNGGPSGDRKAATLAYAKKVISHMRG